MLGAWVVYPLILLALATGAGLLVQLAAGRALPSALRLPCGLALVIAVMDLCTRTTATATLAIPAAIVLGVAGLALGVASIERAGDRRAAVAGLRPGAGATAALVVFCVYAAPIVLSGEATWAGYDKLNDTSIWLAIVDQALAHGRTVSDLAPSTYSMILSGYLTVGYPIGAFLPLGLGHALAGQDIAWLTDPWMAFNASVLAYTLHGAARRVLPRAPSWQAALVASVAAGSTLLYGYYLWGGIKELVAATLIAGAAVATPLPLQGEHRVRAAIPLLVVIWGLVASLSPGGLIWIGPGGLLLIALLALRPRVPWLAAGAGGQSAAGAVPAAAAASARTATPAASGRTPALEGSDAEGTAPSATAAPAPTTGPTDGVGARRGRAAKRGNGKRGAGATSPPSREKRDSARGKHASGAKPGPASGGRTRGARGRPAPPLRPGVAARIRERAVAVARSARALPPGRWAIAAGVLVVAVGLALLLRPGGFVQTFHAALTGGGQLGALAKPLNPLQVAGIWPSGDFRYAPSQRVVTDALIAVVLAGAALAFAASVRRGRWELVAYLLFALAGAALVVVFGSPWIAAKALASASPALPFAALIGGLLVARRQPIAGALVVALVGAGVLWGDLLGYHDVSLAPRALYASLASTNSSVAGQGPTFMTEYSVYGTRHFLRAGDTENPQDLRSRADLLGNGQVVPRPDYADLDEFQLAYVLQYPTIVLQRSPVNTRPPEPYQLVLRNRYWEVWQRAVTPPIISYLPVGDLASGVQPGAVPACHNVLALGRVAGVSQLVAAPATDPIAVNASDGIHPSGWRLGTHLSMHGSGAARIPVNVSTAGRYSVWLEGSVQVPTSISIDGRQVGTARDENEQLGQFVSFGDITLAAGRHVVVLRHSPSLLAPGSGVSDIVGPLLLAPDLPAPALITVPASAAGTLCGRMLSWIEALGA